jgi:hypothetical protein
MFRLSRLDGQQYHFPTAIMAFPYRDNGFAQAADLTWTFLTLARAGFGTV